MANKANYHLLATSRSELRAPSNFFTPQSLRDSPRWGHWGPDSPDPLRRFALRAHFFSPPSHFVTAPWGGTGDRIPQTPCVASLRVRRLLSEHIPPSYEAEGGHGCKEVIIRFGSILVIHLLII